MPNEQWHACWKMKYAGDNIFIKIICPSGDNILIEMTSLKEDDMLVEDNIYAGWWYMH